MNVFAKTKTNEEKEIYEDILTREIVSQKWEEQGRFHKRNLYLQYNLYNSILLPFYMVGPNFVKESDNLIRLKV